MIFPFQDLTKFITYAVTLREINSTSTLRSCVKTLISESSGYRSGDLSNVIPGRSSCKWGVIVQNVISYNVPLFEHSVIYTNKKFVSDVHNNALNQCTTVCLIPKWMKKRMKTSCKVKDKFSMDHPPPRLEIFEFVWEFAKNFATHVAKWHQPQMQKSVVRHRPGPEWGTWGNPQELNWFLPLIKPLRRTRTLRDPVQTQVWSEQVWLDTTFISQGSRSWG